jgi:DNA (cytosine-5)-methyltransferase 1
LTPLECARLQGYDDFVFDKSVSDMQLYKQFGNSVAVPVIRAIAGKIREALFNGSWKI